MPSAAGRPVPPARSLARAAGRARAAHRRGLQAGGVWRPAAAARHMRSGLLTLGWAELGDHPDSSGIAAEHRALAARLLMSLAHYEAEQGRTEYGLSLLDHAEPLAAEADRGVLLSQRGLLFMRTWRGAEALTLLDEAVTLLRDYPDPAYLAGTLLNRSFSHLNSGHVGQARADLVRCERVSAEHGLDLIAAKAVHNLGYCHLLEGDLPAALRLLNAAAVSYRQMAPSMLPVVAMDTARALLAAGLASDAADELDAAIPAFRRQRLDQDHADAELARSQAALAAGDLPAARRWAAAARRRYRRRGNDACASLAELAGLRARAMSPGRAGPVADAAQLIAGRLRGCGLRADADAAELIAARALIAAGRPDAARRRLALVRRGPAMPLDVSLLSRLARAELAEAEARPGAALAELRAGLAMVHARRGRLGSVDLQTGAAALGANLAAAGLRLALDRGSAPLVFAWLERSRAQAFRVRPVRPPADPRAAEMLAELRQLSYLIRQAELNGSRDPAANARRAQLQRQVREHSWEAGGRGGDALRFSIVDVMAALGGSGQSMACLLTPDDRRLAAVVLSQGSVRLIGLGDYERATEASRMLNADLDTLAGRRLPARLEAVITDSIRHQAAVLTAELVAPLRSSLGDGGVVIVPAGTLASVPWSLLPDLRGRPVTVSPSASSWLSAWRRGQPGPAADAPPVLIAGPDLRHAASEVTEIAAVYPGCQTLRAGAATVDATLRALDGATLAHLATHGHHDRENVLFSRLDLADGPLMAYDVQGLTAAPRQVILSACDVGRVVVRPGQEVLGFTAALLHVGTATVVSSVARVPDDTAVGMMTAYHRALTAGARPAEALAGVAAAEPFSPFVCFGAG